MESPTALPVNTTANTTSDEDYKWIQFYERMANGDIPYNTSSYFIEGTTQEGSGPLTLVTPTEQQVEMAKSQLKQNLKRAHSASRTVKRKRRKRTAGSMKRRRKTQKKTKKTKSRAKPRRPAYKKKR